MVEDNEVIDIKNKDSMAIEWASIYDIKPNPRNPRIHPQAAIDKLVKSIKRFGWTNPIIVSTDNIVLAGHARLKAARAAGISNVPIVRVPLTGAEAELYTIADNKLQEETFWDEEALAELMEDLTTNFTLDEFEDIGFTQGELDSLLSEYEDDQERVQDSFPEMRGEQLDVDYVCPKCGYGWSGKPKPE